MRAWLQRVTIGLVAFTVPALSQPANEGPAILARATKMYDAGQYAAALRELEPVLRGSGDIVPVAHLSARCLAGLDALPASRELYLRLIAASPDNATFYCERAVVVARMGDAKRARADLATAKSIDATAPGLQLAMRDVEAALQRAPAPLGEGEGARLIHQLHDRALKGDADQQLSGLASQTMLRTNANRLYCGEAYYDRRRELKNAAAANPGQAARQAELAEFLYDEVTLIQGARVSPKQPWRSFRPSSETSRARELAAADAAADAALKLDPAQPRALYCKGGILLKQSSFAEALPLLESAVAKDPANDRAKLLLAEALYQSANSCRSNAALLKTPRLVRIQRRGDEEISIYDDPTPQMIARSDQLQKLATEQKSRADALSSTAARNINARPTHTSAAPQLQAAWAQIDAGNLAAAAKLLEQGLTLDPADARVAACFGAIAQRSGNREDALAWFRAALALEESRLAGQGLLPATRWSSQRPDEMGLYLACNEQVVALCRSLNRSTDAQAAQDRIDAERNRLEKWNRAEPVTSAYLPGGMASTQNSRTATELRNPTRQADAPPANHERNQVAQPPRSRRSAYDPNQ